MDYINAFWVGGLICALVQILMEKTKMLPGRIMVLLVCLGAVLGALQIYQPFIEFAGAGASVPLPGFGNTLWTIRAISKVCRCRSQCTLAGIWQRVVERG